MRAAALLAVLAGCASAHFTLVHKKGQIACDYDVQDGQNWLAMPLLQDQPFSEWWMHGQVDCQNRAIEAFELPANGNTQLAMSSRTHLVSPPWGEGAFRPSDPGYVLTRGEWGTR